MRLLAKYHQARRSMSPNANSMFCLIFMRDTITMEIFPSLWGKTLPRIVDGVPRRLIQRRMI